MLTPLIITRGQRAKKMGMSAQGDPVSAIREDEATETIATIFADIRETLNVEVVNLVWRHLATMPGALEWVWGILKPLYKGPAIVKAELVHQNLNLPRVPRLSRDVLTAAGLDDAALASIFAILDSYQHTNALALVCFSALLARFEGSARRQMSRRPLKETRWAQSVVSPCRVSLLLLKCRRQPPGSFTN